MLVRCPHGHEYMVNWGKFKSGRRCPYCSNRVKITREEVEKHLKEEGYTLTGDFVNGNTPTYVLCPHGHEWKTTYQKFKKGRRCSHCKGYHYENGKAVKHKDEHVEKMMCQEGYTLETIYRAADSSKKVSGKCSQGHEFDTYLSHFIKGHRCQVCAGQARGEQQKTPTTEVDRFLSEIGFKRVGEYKNNDSPLHVICPEGHHTHPTLGNMQKGVRCKYCHISSGEKRVSETLESMGSYYDREVYTLNEDEEVMIFDFVVYHDKQFENIKYIIEYDGHLHFHHREGFSDLSVVQARDKRKNTYCKEKGIPLLRIPYWDYDNVGKIVKEFEQQVTVKILREGK